jgi:hypothetical protein
MPDSSVGAKAHDGYLAAADAVDQFIDLKCFSQHDARPLGGLMEPSLDGLWSRVFFGVEVHPQPMLPQGQGEGNREGAVPLGVTA